VGVVANRIPQAVRTGEPGPEVVRGPIAWQLKGAWEIENGRLVNRSRSHEPWPNESVV